MLLWGTKVLINMFANHTPRTTQCDPIVSQCYSWTSTQRTVALLHLGRSWSSLRLCQLVPLHRLALKTMELDELGWNQLDFGIEQRCLASRNPRIRCRFGTLTVPGVRVTATEGTAESEDIRIRRLWHYDCEDFAIAIYRNCFRKHLKIWK